MFVRYAMRCKPTPVDCCCTGIPTPSSETSSIRTPLTRLSFRQISCGFACFTQLFTASRAIRKSSFAIRGSVSKISPSQKKRQVIFVFFWVSVMNARRAVCNPFASKSIGIKPRAKLRTWDKVVSSPNSSRARSFGPTRFCSWRDLIR